MAELNLGKGLTAGKVASNVQKKLTRAQEKVRGAARLQMFGGLQVSRSPGPPRRPSKCGSAAASSRRSVASRPALKTLSVSAVMGTGVSHLKELIPLVNVIRPMCGCCREPNCALWPAGYHFISHLCVVFF